MTTQPKPVSPSGISRQLRNAGYPVIGVGIGTGRRLPGVYVSGRRKFGSVTVMVRNDDNPGRRAELAAEVAEFLRKAGRFVDHTPGKWVFSVRATGPAPGRLVKALREAAANFPPMEPDPHVCETDCECQNDD
ncbi:hypothetical protein FXF51_05905 [Nonomuraea sp. PA05]|uniref:hypothetical protein n=1 Tax=Nonomuraea sp. PA05 TaxID=2604466 RepID=UPI0011DBCA5F|nr:hypothetical protein [Nonomuraea sp. PA05]TYB69694.1 hypothetical protein FXF51_05905 [Nonomuraea sp. PA05]